MKGGPFSIFKALLHPELIICRHILSKSYTESCQMRSNFHESKGVWVYKQRRGMSCWFVCLDSLASKEGKIFEHDNNFSRRTTSLKDVTFWLLFNNSSVVVLNSEASMLLLLFREKEKVFIHHDNPSIIPLRSLRLFLSLSPSLLLLYTICQRFSLPHSSWAERSFSPSLLLSVKLLLSLIKSHDNTVVSER